MTDETLFDADAYIDKSKAPKRKRATKDDDPARPRYVVPEGQEWHVVAGLDGAKPEAHLERKRPGREAEQVNRAGGLITACEQVGRSVHVIAAGSVAYLCRDCINRTFRD